MKTSEITSAFAFPKYALSMSFASKHGAWQLMSEFGMWLTDTYTPKNQASERRSITV